YLHLRGETQRSDRQGPSLTDLGFPKGRTLITHPRGDRFPKGRTLLEPAGERSDLKRGRSLTGGLASGQAGTAKLEGASSTEKNATISPSTIKNYVSDINHFLNFIAGSIQEPIVQPVHITPAVIKAYTTAAATQLSQSSLNRHLSSLRFFGRFLVTARLLENDPAQNLTNPTFDPTLAQVITRYQKYLQTENLSKSTVKNYVSDLKKYLLWARRNIKTTDEALTTRSLI
ncbi:site-specific integrase, partial [Microgenomates group bacterium]|nr:site-specific integrase [Microgenomates group bacterium]